MDQGTRFPVAMSSGSGAESARGLALPGWYRIATGALLIAIWSAVLAGAPALLPVQMASWLAFLALIVTPGYLLGDLLISNTRLDWVERLAIAFPLGIAVLGIPGMVSLLGHGTVTQLAIGWTVVSAAVILVWVAFVVWNSLRNREGAPADIWKLPQLLALLVVALLFALGAPALMLYKLDGDAYAVGSFAADALAGLPLNGTEPLFGTNLGPGVRMDFNQWLPMSYLWSYLSGIDPLLLAAQASRIMVAVWSLFALYTLGKAAGVDRGGEESGRRLGLLAAGIQMVIYLANPFLRGDSVSWFFFERTTADKFMVPIVMLPVVFAFTIRYVRSGRIRMWAVAAISTLAVSAIHPLIAAMMAMALTAFGGFHVLLNLKSRTAWLRTGFVAVLVVFAMIIPAIQLVISRGDAPLAPSYPSTLEGWPVGHKLVPVLPYVYMKTLDTYGPMPDLSQLDASEADSSTNPFLIWRYSVNMNRRRLIALSLDRYFSDPNIVFEPAYLLALLLLPFLFGGIRKDKGAQFVVSTTLGVLFVMFNPWLTPLIGALVMPWILWRFVWMIPYALIIAMAGDRLLPRVIQFLKRIFSRTPAQQRSATSRSLQYASLSMIVLAAAVLSPAAAHNLSALQERAGYPYYFPTPDHLLAELDRKTSTLGSATVLADQDLSVVIPAYAANANIVAHRMPTTSEIFPADRQQEALQRLIDQDTFFRSRYLTEDAIEVLNRYDVGYVIAASGSDLDIQMQLATDWFEWIIDDQSYSLYQVRQLPTTVPVVEGNSALAQRQWDTADALYEKALELDPDNLLALAGLAEISQARGEFASAISHYEEILRRADLPVVNYRLGNIYRDMGQLDRAIAEYDAAQQMAPQISRFHTALGDVCFSAGRDTCAAEQYAAAVANQNLPDASARLVAQADMWRQRGRTDKAIEYYEEAVDLQPSEANQLMLVSAYQEEERFDEAEALLGIMRMQRPLSTEVLRMSADVSSAQGKFDESIRDLRRAIRILDVTGQESAEMRLILAQAQADDGLLEEAKDQVLRVLKLQPENALAYGLLGDVYGQLGLALAATDAYMQAFSLDPTQVQLYLRLTNQFRQQGGKQDDVLELLQTAIRANPDEAALALALGDQYQQRGDTEAAIEAYQAALDKMERTSTASGTNPRSTNTGRAFALIRLASVSEDRGQLEPAMNYYSAAVAAAPDVPWTHATYGDALRRRGDADGAAQAYQRAMEVDGDFANAYVRLADLLEAQGNATAAAALMDEALSISLEQTASAAEAKGYTGLGKLTPDAVSSDLSFDSDADATAVADSSSIDAAERLIAELMQSDGIVFEGGEGAALLGLLTQLTESGNDAPDIALLYQKAIDKGTQAGWYPVDLARYYKGQGDLYLLQGQPVLATEAYRNASNLDDWWPQARIGLARALEETGQQDEALAQLRTAVDIAPGYVEAQIALAEALSERGLDDDAYAILAATAESHPGNARATTALARAQGANRAWSEAEENYRKTISLNPGDPDAYVDLAALLIEQARYDEARPLLATALETDGESVNAFIQSGVLEQRLGNEERAFSWFRRARDLQPNSEAVTLVLIDLLSKYGQYETALGYAQDWLKAEPQNVEMLLRLARIQRATGHYTEALGTLLDASRKSLADARLSAELGELYVDQGRPQAALSAYRQAVALAPSETEYYLRVAELLNNQANLDAGEKSLRSGLARAKQPALLYAALADIYIQQGNPGDAKDILEQGMAKLGDNSALAVAMGLYLDSQVQRSSATQEGAEQWYTGFLSRHPEDAAVHRSLGDHYLRVERVDDALEQYELAVELEPANASFLIAEGGGYEAVDRPADAEEAYKAAILLRPSEPDAALALGKLYRGQERWDDAEAVYEAALRSMPASGAVLTAMASLWADQGDTDNALAYLDKAAKLSPSTDTLVARADVYSSLDRMDEAKGDLELALAKEPGLLSAMLALGDLHRESGDTRSANRTFVDASELRPGVPAGRVRVIRNR
ncbi:MAG: tetratricopeptide repeat protein [Caldilineaceae bacterium]